MSGTYELRAEGHLDERWSDAPGSLSASHQEDGTTLLVGRVVDQVALHGGLATIRDLGPPLLAPRRINDESSEANGTVPGNRREEIDE